MESIQSSTQQVLYHDSHPVEQTEARFEPLESVLSEHVRGKEVVMVLGDRGVRNAESDLLKEMQSVLSAKHIFGKREIVFIGGGKDKGGSLASSLASSIRDSSCIQVGFVPGEISDESEFDINAANFEINSEAPGDVRPTIYSDVMRNIDNEINGGKLRPILLVFGSDCGEVAESVIAEAKRGTQVVLMTEALPDGSVADDGASFNRLFTELKELSSSSKTNIHIVKAGLNKGCCTSECASDNEVVMALSLDLSNLRASITAADIRRAHLTGVKISTECMTPCNLKEILTQPNDTVPPSIETARNQSQSSPTLH